MSWDRARRLLCVRSIVAIVDSCVFIARVYMCSSSFRAILYSTPHTTATHTFLYFLVYVTLTYLCIAYNGYNGTPLQGLLGQNLKTMAYVRVGVRVRVWVWVWVRVRV